MCPKRTRAREINTALRRLPLIRAEVLKMRTLCTLCLVFSILLSSAAMADRPAMRAALGGLLGNSSTDPNACGNPDTNRIAVPIPIVLGRFFQPVRIFPVVRGIEGDAKDQARVEAAMKAELQKVAFRCNFTVASGVKAPAGSITLAITLVKDHGQSTATSSSSSTDGWGSSDHRSSNYRSGSVSSSTFGESTFVGTSVSGGLDLNEADGSTTGLAFVGDVFSGNSERTGSAYQDSSRNNYEYSSRRWGSSHSERADSNSSTFRSDPEFSKSQSSRVTINEAVEKAVYCVLAQGIDYYNITKGPKGACNTTTVVSNKNTTSGYTGNPAYIAEDE